MTYPLLLAMERDRELTPALEAHCAAEDTAVEPELGRRVALVMVEKRVVDDCLELASRLCGDAVQSLEALPESPAKAALEGVAMSTPRRRR
jgi:octaprenyl-diphosphate synthase